MVIDNSGKGLYILSKDYICQTIFLSIGIWQKKFQCGIRWKKIRIVVINPRPTYYLIKSNISNTICIIFIQKVLVFRIIA